MPTFVLKCLSSLQAERSIVFILQKFSINVTLSSKIIFYLDKLQKVSSGCNYIMNRHFTVLVKFGSYVIYNQLSPILGFIHF